MKAVLSLLTLASSALAANIVRDDYGHGGYGHDKPGKEIPVTTEVIVTYTTVCPVTEIITKSGKPVYVTYTTTSTVTEKKPTVIYKTVKVDVTETVHTTYVKTAYEVTDIYQTVTCPEIVYTTISEGKTVKVTKTNTITKYITDIHTVKTVIPVTVTDVVQQTVGVTKGGKATVTDYSTMVIKTTNTVTSEIKVPPTTTVIPVTSTQAPAPPSTLSIVTAAANGNHQMSPVMALVAGALGAIAMI